MQKIKFILLVLAGFLFSQCKPSQQLLRLMKSEYEIKSFNGHKSIFFDECRKSMIRNLSADVKQNDTIIILEYVKDILGPTYGVTMYESKSNKQKSFRASYIRKKNGEARLDSLMLLKGSDKKLSMILNNQLDEVKKRGDASGVTPSTELIVTIFTKNKDTEKFEVKTVRTNNFYITPPDSYIPVPRKSKE